jgi:hypothetical protein
MTSLSLVVDVGASMAAHGRHACHRLGAVHAIARMSAGMETGRDGCPVDMSVPTQAPTGLSPWRTCRTGRPRRPIDPKTRRPIVP